MSYAARAAAFQIFEELSVTLITFDPLRRRNYATDWTFGLHQLRCDRFNRHSSISQMTGDVQ